MYTLPNLTFPQLIQTSVLALPRTYMRYIAQLKALSAPLAPQIFRTIVTVELAKNDCAYDNQTKIEKIER